MILFRLHSPQGFGYHDKKASPHLLPFFGAGNIAFRRECLDEIGIFDPEMQFGEDTDLTLRVLSTQWRIFSMEKARSRHRVTYGLGLFTKKWFLHGYYLARIYKKHHGSALEVFRRNGTREVGKSRFDCIYYSTRFPIHGIIFIDSFYLFHIFAWLFLCTKPTGPLHFAFGVAVVLSLARYLRGDLRTGSTTGTLRSIFMRYLWNAMQICGGICGGLRQKRIILNATV